MVWPFSVLFFYGFLLYLSCCGSVGVEDFVFAKWVCLFLIVVYVGDFAVKVFDLCWVLSWSSWDCVFFSWYWLLITRWCDLGFYFDRFYYVYLNTVLVKWLRLFFSKLDVAMYWVWADFLAVCSFLDCNFFGPLSLWCLACDLIVLFAFVFWFVLIWLESILVWYYFLLLLPSFIGPVWLIECLDQELYRTPNVFWSLRDTSIITLVWFWVYDPGEAVVFVEVHI